MKRENSDSFNAYNFVVRDFIEMDFEDRMMPEPVDLRLANLTLVNVPPVKKKTGFINNLIKIIKAV